MANIPIRDIPGAVVASPDPSNLIPMDNGSIMQKTTIANAVNTTLPLSSQAEAEAGVDNVKRMSSLRTKQAIDAQTPSIVNVAITALNLGTMSQEEASDYTPTSGLAAVALSNDYDDLDNLPTLGTAAATDATDYATAAQGAAADTAVQPGDLAAVATSGDYDDLSNKPTLGTMAAETASDYTKTSGLGALALKDKVSVSDIDATGTADNTTYLRGDGTWSAAAGGSVDALFTEDLGKSSGEQQQARENIGAQINLYTVTPEEFGAVGDGVADDTFALSAAVTFADETGAQLEWGGVDKVYRITSMISRTAAKNIFWHSSGATVWVDSASPIHAALKLETNSHSIKTSGLLNIEGNDKTFAGLWIENNGLLPALECKLFGINVFDCYRSSMDYAAGDGIFVRGGFRTVIISDVTVKGVKMAVGASDPGVQGVTGISVCRVNNTTTDNDFVLISNFVVENVYSEDVSIGARDQDGIRIQQAYTRNETTDGVNVVSAIVTNGRFKNCHGRAVKMVSEQGIVDKVHIIRNSEIYSGFSPGSSEDIDFQVGGGTVRNVWCYYEGNCPQSVVTFVSNLTSGRRNNTQCLIDNINVSAFGSVFPKRIADVIMLVAPTHPGSIKVNISNIQVGGISSDLDEVVRLNNPNDVSSSNYFMVSLMNVAARINNAFVWRNHASIGTTVIASGYALENLRPATIPLASGTITTAITQALAGANNRVSTTP